MTLNEFELAAKLGVHRNIVALWRLKGHITPFKTTGKGNGTRHLYKRHVVKNQLVKAGKLLVDKSPEIDT